MCPAMQQGFPFSHIGLHCLKVVSTQICLEILFEAVLSHLACTLSPGDPHSDSSFWRKSNLQLLGILLAS